MLSRPGWRRLSRGKRSLKRVGVNKGTVLSGKPLNPINHVSRKAREGSVRESPDSPYAPKRVRQRAGTEWHPVESDRDPRSPYTPKQARAQPVTSRFAGDDAEQPAAARRDQIMSDHDLERLEASLRQLLRQESATRLRASNLAPVPRLAPVHASGRRHSGERFGDGFRSPRSLEPARRPPPAMSRRNIGTPVGIVVVSILVATVAYYVAVGRWVLSSEPAHGPQTTSSDPTVVAPPSGSTDQHVFRPTMPQDKDRATSAQNEISSQQGTETSQPARPSGDETAGMLPGEPGAQVGSVSKASRVLDPEEIKLFMKQGEQFIAAGDVVTARIVFQRAAEAGDANAPMALGATYDPTVLAKLGVAGLGADVEKARTWYQKAESLGSTEATRRLAILANR
jgi:hypothetical protein